MPTARINLASIDIDKLNQICNSITEIAKKTKTQIAGPITLPTKKLKITTRKSKHEFNLHFERATSGALEE